MALDYYSHDVVINLLSLSHGNVCHSPTCILYNIYSGKNVVNYVVVIISVATLSSSDCDDVIDRENEIEGI